MFPKVKFVIIWLRDIQISGMYDPKNQVAYLNPFKYHDDDYTVLEAWYHFFATWLHEFFHHVLRRTPKLDDFFQSIHERYKIL